MTTKPTWYEPTPEDEIVFAQEMLQIAVSEAINGVMEKTGVNRAELARRCGITRSALSQSLSGRRSMTLVTIAKILHALNFHLEVKAIADEQPEPAFIMEPLSPVIRWDAAHESRSEQERAYVSW